MDELLKDIAKKPQAGEKGEKDKDKGEKQQENNDPVLPMASGTKLFVAAGRAMLNEFHHFLSARSGKILRTRKIPFPKEDHRCCSVISFIR